MNARAALFLGLTTLALATLLRCAGDTASAGNGSQTGNASVVGRLVLGDGSAADGALVEFVAAEAAAWPPPGTGIERYTALTGPSGNYSFDSLPGGYYTVWGQLDSAGAFRDSVLVVDGGLTDVGTDTLRAPGSISCTVVLRGADDPRTVLAVVLGSAVIFGCDSTGMLTFGPVPEGCYRVRILSWLDDYAPLDTVLCVLSGRNDTATTSVELPLQTLVAPTGLTVRADTGAGTVTLSWDPVKNVTGPSYLVYRNDSANATPELITTVAVHDTFYVDTVFTSPADTAQFRLWYRLRTQDSLRNQSVEFSAAVAVDVAGPGILWPILKWLVTPGQLLIDESAPIAVEVHCRACVVDSLVWAVGSRDSVVRAIGVAHEPFVDTLDFSRPQEGVCSVFVSARAVGTGWATAALGVQVASAVANPVLLSCGELDESSIRLFWTYADTPAGRIDSVRVICGLSAFPAGVYDPATSFPVAVLGGDVTEHVVTGLSPGTWYYFAAQAKVRGRWTATADTSCTHCMTRVSDCSGVHVTGFSFDSLASVVRVVWSCLDSAMALDSQSMFGYAIGPTRASVSTLPDTWQPLTQPVDTTDIAVPPAVLAGTVAHVALWTRCLDGTTSRATVLEVWLQGEPASEPIVYFSSTVGDTVFAFDSAFALWYPGTWTLGQNRDTLELIEGLVAPDSLAIVSIAVRFRQAFSGPAMVFGFACDSTLMGQATLGDVRAYVVDRNGLWVAANTTHVTPGRPAMVHAGFTVEPGATYTATVRK